MIQQGDLLGFQLGEGNGCDIVGIIAALEQRTPLDLAIRQRRPEIGVLLGGQAGAAQIQPGQVGEIRQFFQLPHRAAGKIQKGTALRVVPAVNGDIAAVITACPGNQQRPCG